MRHWRTVAGYLILCAGIAVAVSLSYTANRRAIVRNAETLELMCGVFTDVIKTAYAEPPAVDPETLPERTRQLLADLAPLIAGQSQDGKREATVLAKLHRIPGC